MDKKIKLLRYFLNYLSKKFKFQEISFDNFNDAARFLGYKDFVENKLLFNFYNENVIIPSINWDTISSDKLKPFIHSFLGKIQNVVSHGGRDLDNLFNDSELMVNKGRYDTYQIEFLRNNIQFDFNTRSSDTFLDLLNIEQYSMDTYISAKQGQGYDPDYDDNTISYLLQLLDDENLNILHTILRYIGRPDLTTFNRNSNDDLTAEVINAVSKVLGNNFTNDLYYEYKSLVEESSIESVVESFYNHFPDDITYYDSSSFAVSYDYFIKYLIKYPDINSFSDITKYPLIEDSLTDLSEALYDYNLSYDKVNEEFKPILEELLEKVEEDEDLGKRIKNVENFTQIVKKLGFIHYPEDGLYRKYILNKNGEMVKKFQVIEKEIDYDESKVQLYMTDKDKETVKTRVYKIPFDELANYVTLEKLYESILFEIRKYLLKN